MFRIKYSKKFELLVLFLSVFTFVLAPSSRALEITISDNGNGSESEVSVQVETQTVVDQTNEANNQNNIVEDANTGDNSVNSNTNGETNIQTGDINATTSVNNVLNTSSAQVDTCCEPNEITVSANGDNSKNTAILNYTNATNVKVESIANINNFIDGTANTGVNKANNNMEGKVNINTGNITVSNNITNNPINTSDIKVSSGIGSTSVLIKENGSDSENVVLTLLSNELSVYLGHTSNIGNYILWDANTGDNEANGNLGGDVNITTGSVDLLTFINNLANMGEVDVECCEKVIPGNGDQDEDDDTADDEEKPSNGEDEQSDDDVGGESEGLILPSAAATEAGGPGILGLSDTSSTAARNLFFWFSLILFTVGGKITLEEIIPTTSRNKQHK